MSFAKAMRFVVLVTTLTGESGHKRLASLIKIDQALSADVLTTMHKSSQNIHTRPDQEAKANIGGPYELANHIS